MVKVWIGGGKKKLSTKLLATAQNSAGPSPPTRGPGTAGGWCGAWAVARGPRRQAQAHRGHQPGDDQPLNADAQAGVEAEAGAIADVGCLGQALAGVGVRYQVDIDVTGARDHSFTYAGGQHGL